MIDRGFGRPVPGQEIVEPAHGMTVSHALEHVFEVGERLDVIELCCGDKRANGGPACAAAVRACEQMVLAAERDRSDGTLDRIVVEIDAAIVQEATKGRPAGESVTDRLGQAAAARDATKLHPEPGFHSLDQRSRLGVTHGPALLSGASSDSLLDCVELADPAQRFCGDRRAGRLMHIIELPARMCPTGG